MDLYVNITVVCTYKGCIYFGFIILVRSKGITTVVIAVIVYIIDVNAVVCIVSDAHSSDIDEFGTSIIIVTIMSRATIITNIVTFWVVRFIITCMVLICIDSFGTIVIQAIFICRAWDTFISSSFSSLIYVDLSSSVSSIYILFRLEKKIPSSSFHAKNIHNK